jgi:nitroimidazol reductase NimA-like FMN-containing flavoprotein (pyridoxamine 5'-phosphate oxidase superfamily)
MTVTRGRGPWSRIFPGTFAGPERDFRPSGPLVNSACLGSEQAVSDMARQIGPWMADPQVGMLETRLNALDARLRELETRYDRAPDVGAPERWGTTGGMESIVEELTEAESLRLITQAEVGRIGFSGRFGPVVLPVNFKVLNGSIVFRTEAGSPLGEDLRTGIADAEYKVAFEIDEINPADRTGWSVLIQGAAHYVDDEEERAAVLKTGVEPWVGGEREVYLQITPTVISGRRVSRG